MATRDAKVEIRVSDRERAIFDELAELHGLSISAYVRTTVLAQKREIERQNSMR